MTCACNAGLSPNDPTVKCLNLTVADDTTCSVASAGMTRASITFEPARDASGTSWAAELEWSLDNKAWFSFDSAVTFNDSGKGKRNVDVTATKFLRVRTTTADTNGDTQCRVVIWTSNQT